MILRFFKCSLLAAAVACVLPVTFSAVSASAGSRAGLFEAVGPRSAGAPAASRGSYSRYRWSTGRRWFGARPGFRYSSRRGWFKGKSYFGHHRWFAGKSRPVGIGGARAPRQPGAFEPVTGASTRHGSAAYNHGRDHKAGSGGVFEPLKPSRSASLTGVAVLPPHIVASPFLVPIRKVNHVRHFAKHRARHKKRARVLYGQVRRVKRNRGRVRFVTPGLSGYITAY